MLSMIDLIGEKFGALEVIKQEKTAKDGHTRWLCLCKCGRTKIMSGKYLRKGKTKDCGCGISGSKKEKIGRKFNFDKKETLCWTCSLVGTSKCSWDREFKPVNGWEAEETKIWNSMKQDYWKSYRVISCPMKK